MPEKIEYQELFDLSSTLLSKDDLFSLEKILVEDPKTDRIDIKLLFDSTNLSAESFKELLSNPDIPTYTDKLSINMQRWIDTEDYKGISSGVSLSPHHNHITCQIHSIDQTWFLGKKVPSRKVLQTKKTLVFLVKQIVACVSYYSHGINCLWRGYICEKTIFPNDSASDLFYYFDYCYYFDI